MGRSISKEKQLEWDSALDLDLTSPPHREFSYPMQGRSGVGWGRKERGSKSTGRSGPKQGSAEATPASPPGPQLGRDHLGRETPWCLM